MLFVWIALWLVAFVLVSADFRSAVHRRLAGVAFSGGAGALAAVLDQTIIPHVAAVYREPRLEEALYAVQATSSLLSYYGLPYAFLLFGLAYGPVSIAKNGERALAAALLLPIAACLLFTPGYNETYPVTHSVVVWWAVPYIAAGAVMMLLRGKDRLRPPLTHWIVSLAVLPPVLFAMTLSYLLPSMGILRMWVYNTWFVGFGFAFFVMGLFTSGFLGLRLLIERRRLDTTLRAVTSGTAILHHAIKNDVGKTKLFCDKMKTYAERTDQAELLEDIRVVREAAAHIQEMIARVHRRTEDLELKLRRADLGALVRDALKPHLQAQPGVEVETELPDGWSCSLDPAQFAEAVNNVVSNAIEAMGGGGRLSVRLVESRLRLTIAVRDSGPGMTKRQCAQALEPFHTTKGGAGNFGLGLPYAYHVMRKHRGSLYLQSRPGEGTTVYLALTKRACGAKRLAAGEEGRTGA